MILLLSIATSSLQRTFSSSNLPKAYFDTVCVFPVAAYFVGYQHRDGVILDTRRRLTLSEELNYAYCNFRCSCRQCLVGSMATILFLGIIFPSP
ncbi:hypothetical protein K505DRAFT_23336 [Melanomma pulvis-pyrius CBS 109.77]|uniref:Uncharacterized protein n=1 Tax=Melanomma pulvis-pyrius CBS 109.77 TaxID=1314802 RepID=A0A6A6XEM4_9PLEO|nr:hypothetical protein K505DRAFT_23336 [Melanomma pulvis-pyrius CBS 109.77]